MTTPHGMQVETRRTASLRVRVSTAHADEAFAALTEPNSDAGVRLGGRGEVQHLVLNSGGALLRPHRRGGLMRALLHDAYLFHNRPLAEFAVHCTAFARRAPVVEPLGVRWERRGCLFRGALLTRWVDATPLANIREDAAAHARAGAAVAALHDAGVYHADLNANNILVDAERAWIIDLDRSRAGSRVGRWGRGANILRLQRSYRKLGLSDALFDAFLRAYGAIDIPWPLRCLHALRSAKHREVAP